MKLEVYSDGSATTADKPGGWGYVVVRDGIKLCEGSGHMTGATNNDAELEAAIQGLLAAFKHKTNLMGEDYRAAWDVTLCSDSEIVLGWASGRYKFKQLSKIGQYKKLMMLVQRMGVKTRWIRGHAGDVHNERCDALANAARTGNTNPEAKKKKIRTIGNRVDGVVGLVCVDGRKKLVDLVHNICQDYNEAEHGLREVWIEVEKGQEDQNGGKNDWDAGTV